MPVYVSGAVEGPSDEAVLRRVVYHAGALIHRVQVQNGKSNLRRALPGYNAAAQWSGWLVLVDLDHDFACPGALAADWLPTQSPFMRFRVVVREVEAWLLADAERFAQFFAVRRAAIPNAPESLPDPKMTLVGLSAASRKKAIRADMSPRPGSGRHVGPAYTSRLIEFASDSSRGWRPDVAATSAPSLARCLARLTHLVEHGPHAEQR
jgi:hypothetical protein